jgi:hypothetical protein
MGPGRTTCPLLEMRVCTVRISYRARALGHNTAVEPQGSGCRMRDRNCETGYLARTAGGTAISHLSSGMVRIRDRGAAAQFFKI